MNADDDDGEPSQLPQFPPTLAVEKASQNSTAAPARYKIRREDSPELIGVVLRAAAMVLSLINLIVLGSNRHGDWMVFNRYQEYRYMISVSTVSFVYTAAQVAREMYRRNSGVDWVSKEHSGIVDFVGDQIIAYLLISSLSSAIPITNRMRVAIVNNFTDTSVASISLSFLAFIAIAASALLSGFKVSKQSYL